MSSSSSSDSSFFSPLSAQVLELPPLPEPPLPAELLLLTLPQPRRKRRRRSLRRKMTTWDSACLTNQLCLLVNCVPWRSPSFVTTTVTTDTTDLPHFRKK